MASGTMEILLTKGIGFVLLVVGVIHVAPITGLLGPRQLASLYGVDVVGDPNLTLLLRHRAVLFGLLGASLMVMAFRPSLHTAALALALVSVASFLWLAAGEPGLSTPVRRVVWIDQLALGLLALAAAAQSGRWLLR